MNWNDHIVDKSVAALAESFVSIVTDRNCDQHGALTKTFEQFRDHLKANVTDDPADVHTNDSATTIMDKLKQMVAATGLPLEQFLHTARGASLATRLNELSKRKESTVPQVNIMKLHAVESVREVAKAVNAGELVGVPFSEVLMGHARLVKRAGETDAKAFARLYESDVEFRNADKAATEAGWIEHSKASYPGTMSVEVASTEIGNTLVSDDSYKAAEQLRTLVEAQRARAPTLTTEQLYDAVYRDPANRTITARAHPTTSSTSGDELQHSRPQR